MTLQEKYLYHQIHPLKLSVEVAGTLVGMWPLWHHQLLFALSVMVLPPMLMTLPVIAFMDLEPYKNSNLGRYFAVHMTRAAEGQRILGMCVVASGVWNHSLQEFAIGAAIVALGWLQGFGPFAVTAVGGVKQAA